MDLPETYFSDQKEREYITQLRNKKELTPKEVRILNSADALMKQNIKTILTSRRIKMFRCVSPDGAYIDFQSVLTSNSKSVIVLGLLNGIEVVVKWYKGDKRDCSYEAKIYEDLKEIGCSLPWFCTKFKFLNCQVIAIEKLEKLTVNDEEFEIGAAVLDQLKYIHKIGVHCDIKPLNIMKRVHKGKTTYFLIDFGGLTTQKSGHGYKRWLWSPKWCSQKSHTKDQITTAKNDFIELGYTMKAIQNWKIYNGKDGKYKTGFTGRLAKYKQYVDKLDPYSPMKGNVHDELKTILK